MTEDKKYKLVRYIGLQNQGNYINICPEYLSYIVISSKIDEAVNKISRSQLFTDRINQYKINITQFIKDISKTNEESAQLNLLDGLIIEFLQAFEDKENDNAKIVNLNLFLEFLEKLNNIEIILKLVNSNKNYYNEVFEIRQKIFTIKQLDVNNIICTSLKNPIFQATINILD